MLIWYKCVAKLLERWTFRSRDGIQIVILDLVSDMFIGQHLILFFPKNPSKTVMTIPTASLVVGSCMFLQACLSVRLVRTCYGLSVKGLGLVQIVSRPVCINHPDFTADRPLDPDQSLCITSYRGVEAHPKFSRLFCEFLSPNP